MPSAIEKQMKVEELEGERRSTESARLDTSSRNIGYVLLISIVVIVLAYLAMSRWDTVQGLFQKARQTEQSAEPLEGGAGFVPETSVPTEPSAGQVVRLVEVAKPAVPAALIPAVKPLPLLGESDELYRKRWAELWSDNGIASWVGTEQPVRKTAVVLDNFSQGKIVRNLLGVFKLELPFMVKLVMPASGEEGSVDIYLLDPDSYRRYSPFVTSFTAVDTNRLVGFYLRFRPLFQQAYLELGYPEGDIDRAFRSTLLRIQAVPVQDGAVHLVRPKVMYQFQDQELEQRSALDKQLLRMGPENMRALQQKAKELEVALTQVLE